MIRLLFLACLTGLGILLLTSGIRSARADYDPAAAAMEAAAQEELAAMNAEREADALPLLDFDPVVQDVAVLRAAALAASGALCHADPAGRDAASLLEEAGVWFARWGENIGWSSVAVVDAPARLHAGWMESSAHRANILDPGFRRVGISFAADGVTIFAVVTFLN